MALNLAPVIQERPLSEDEVLVLSEQLDELEAALREAGDDPALRTLHAATSLRLGRIQMSRGQDPTWLFEDARRSALAAAEADPANGRAHALAGWAAWMLGNAEEAAAHAAAALPHLAADASSPLAYEALTIFTRARRQALLTALESASDWPAEWVPDLRAAYEVLLEHPRLTEQQVLDHLEWLDIAGIWAPMEAAVRRGLEHMPESGWLHGWYRNILLRDGGAEAVEDAYLGGPLAGDPAVWDWYAGVSLIAAAERHVENRQPEEALAAYLDAVERLEASGEARADFYDSANHHAVLALAGCARVETDAGDLRTARALLLRAMRKRPGSAAEADGLGNSPADTARRVIAALNGAGRGAEAQAFREELAGSGLDLGASN